MELAKGVDSGRGEELTEVINKAERIRHPAVASSSSEEREGGAEPAKVRRKLFKSVWVMWGSVRA